MADQADELILYTDGACSGNPGPGGWAYILKHVETGRMKKDSGSVTRTTNNRMELMAVIEGLSALTRSCRIRVITDSQYVNQGITEWIHGWKRNGWKRGKKPLKNVDLWQALDEVRNKHDATFEHVLGHSGHPENEECDRMAVVAAKSVGR